MRVLQSLISSQPFSSSPRTSIFSPFRPMARVIVVGGGLAGLSAAHTLLERGANVILLDKQPYVATFIFSRQGFFTLFPLDSWVVTLPRPHLVSTVLEPRVSRTSESRTVPGSSSKIPRNRYVSHIHVQSLLVTKSAPRLVTSPETILSPS